MPVILVPSRQRWMAAGIAAGPAAWALGYLVTYVVVASGRYRGIFTSTLGFSGVPALHRGAGWVYFNAHWVAVIRHVPGPADGPGPTAAVTFIGGPTGFTPLLYAVPVVTLVAAGTAVAYVTGSRGPSEGLIAGLAVVPGYLLLSVLGVLETRVSWPIGAFGGAPAPVDAVVQAGILYPVVCAGGAGLVVGTILARSSSVPDRSRPDASGETEGS